MEKPKVQKLAAVLKILVTITFACNLVALLLVPGLVGIRGEGGWFAASAMLPAEPGAPVWFLLACWQYLFRWWREPYGAVLTVFLWACGACTAVVLWQARRVLGTILAGTPFHEKNAVSLKRAAVCCFLISGAALARTVWGICFYRSLLSMLTYNALFVPVFLMGGLLCLVMSALFRQAAEIKAENDLTI